MPESQEDARGQAAPQAFALEIRTKDGTIRGTFAVPPRPMRLSELALNFMSISDRLAGLAAQREAREGRAISCRKGCTACCRHIVPLSPPEAWLVADLVAAMPAEIRARTLAGFRAAREAYVTIGARMASTNVFESNDEALRLTVAYFRQGVPCPFLHDEACSIYNYRPSICREYAVTSPAENCFRLPDLPIARVPVAVRLSGALSRLTSILLGREPEEIPLTLALDWAAEHAEEGKRTWDAATLIKGLLSELTPQE